jgi:hypothetical protein
VLTLRARTMGRVRISRVVAARIIVVLATIALWAGGFGLWVAREALDTDQWTETSSELLQDPAIQQALAGYLADQVVAPSATTRLEDVLPQRADALAVRAGAAIGDLAERAALRVLRSGRFQSLWTEANRRAHTRLMAVIDDDEATDVTLDLQPLLQQVRARIGLEEPLPPGAGQFEILSSDQLETTRTIARALRSGSIVALLLALALYVIAVWAAGPGRRPGMLLLCGIGIVSAGLLMLVVRRVAGAQIVDAVAAGGGAVTAAENAWTIATSVLDDIAGVTIAIGVVVIVVAWLAGPSRPATWLRAQVAPVLHERPGLAYGTAIAAVLLLLAIGVLPADHAVLAVLIYVALAVGAVFALQRLIPRSGAAAP